MLPLLLLLLLLLPLSSRLACRQQMKIPFHGNFRKRCSLHIKRYKYVSFQNDVENLPIVDGDWSSHLWPYKRCFSCCYLLSLLLPLSRFDMSRTYQQLMEIGFLVCDPIVTATATTADAISFGQLRFTSTASLCVFWSFHVLFAGQKSGLAPKIILKNFCCETQ